MIWRIEEPPMNFNTPLYNKYKDYGLIDHVQEYAHKAGLIKTENDVLGVVFKGVGESFDVQRISDFIIEGEFVDFRIAGAGKTRLMREMTNPLTGIASGALFTALIQSSSATTGIVIIMASQGLIGPGAFRRRPMFRYRYGSVRDHNSVPL